MWFQIGPLALSHRSSQPWQVFQPATAGCRRGRYHRGIGASLAGGFDGVKPDTTAHRSLTDAFRYPAQSARKGAISGA